MKTNSLDGIEIPVGSFNDTMPYCHTKSQSTKTTLPHYLMLSDTIYREQPSPLYPRIESIQAITISTEADSSPTNVQYNLFNKHSRVTGILLDLEQEDSNDSSFFLTAPSEIKRKDDYDRCIILPKDSPSDSQESIKLLSRKRSSPFFDQNSIEEPKPKPQVKKFNLLPRPMTPQTQF